MTDMPTVYEINVRNCAGEELDTLLARNPTRAFLDVYGLLAADRHDGDEVSITIRIPQADDDACMSDDDAGEVR